MGVSWNDEIDTILAGDLTAVLGYPTPAGGAVVTPVAPVGLRDRAAGTVGFTTSLGFGRKLERIQRDPRVALAFHAREHGLATSPRFVLVQGRARVVLEPSPEERARLAELATPLLGGRRRGWFWDRWLREYYDVRVHVHVEADIITTWPDLRCAGPPTVLGAPPPGDPPAPQRPPQKGTGPRVDAERAGKRLGRTDHLLLGYVGADGYPCVVPVGVGHADAAGLAITTAAHLPAGGRRAGLVGHSFRAQLIGLEVRQFTGWLEVGDSGARYAPHTEHGFRAPANKTLLLLLNGMLAKWGVRTSRRRTNAHPSASS